MSRIFEENVLKGMRLRNRIVRSATWEGMCDADGGSTPKLEKCYQDLAEGEVGLIITGYTFVRRDGRQLPRKMGLDTDGVGASMRRLTDGVHRAGGRICVQLVHAGGQTTSAEAGRQPLAPSAVKAEQFEEMPSPMSLEDIRNIVAAFAEAAGRAKAWGFDGVQLHAAHGYLINQFLSPHTNLRADDYGGSVENRARFLMENYRAVRDAVGSSYPVMVKLNGSDFLEGGLSPDDAATVAGMLDQEGTDAIEVSGGTPASGDLAPVRRKIKHRDQEGYNLGLVPYIRKKVRCPLMVVGGFRSYDLVEEVLAKGEVDYVSLARPFIREPDLARRWRNGDKGRARCISCNKCFRPGFKGEGIYCVVEREEREKSG